MFLNAPKVTFMTTLGYLGNGGAFLEKANWSASPSEMFTSPSLHYWTKSSPQAQSKLTAS